MVLKFIKSLVIVFSLVLMNLFAVEAQACDLCSIYISMDTRNSHEGNFHLGASEQFTNLDDVRDGGRKISEEIDQYLRSSITQFFFAYDISDTFTTQINVPLIIREYRRIEGGGAETGSESGLGDISLLARWKPYRYVGASSSISLEFRTGLKLPTGDSDPLGEELAEGHGHGMSSEDESGIEDDSEHDDHLDEHGHSAFTLLRHAGEDHGDIVSAVHGHDVALGSGSIDVPFGGTFIATYDRLLGYIDAQYNIRSNGRYDYRYANEFFWRAGTGIFVVTDHEFALSTNVSFSGAHKGKDRLNGISQGDTSIRTFFVGPEVNLTYRNKLAAELGLDLPAEIDNSEVGITPSYRLRAALSYRF